MKAHYFALLLAALFVVSTILLPTAQGQSLRAPINFDLDGDGLLSETERKAQLDFLSLRYPVINQREFLTVTKDAQGRDVEIGEFREALFDADNDGKVTLEEMTEGRHPITKVMRESFLRRPVADDTLKIPDEYKNTRIRCMVKAVGALDQPEAWTR